MKKKSFLVGALLAQGLFSFADVNFTIDDLTIAANETRTVYVNVELDDPSKISSFEMDVQLPAGLTFVGTDDMWTSNKIESDYGWTLVRAKKDPTKFHFMGYGLTEDLLLKDKKMVAFQFDVKADDTFDPKTAGDIELNDVKVANVFNKPSYKVEGDLKYSNGDILGIYRLYGENNKFTVDGGLAEETIELTPKHTKLITFELNNPKVEDNPLTPEDESLTGGDPNVRGLQGIIHLPKGIKIKAGSEKKTVRTINESSLLLGTPEADGEGTAVSFNIFASSAPLRSCLEYDTPIFTFELEGDETAQFDQQQVVVTVDNLVASKYKDSKRYILDDVVTITIDNPNQVAKDNVWDPAVADLQKQLNDQIAKINADNSNVRNYIGITEQEDKAQKAIDDLAAAIKDVYDAGDLRDDSDFKDLLDDADKQINEILNKEVEKAEAAAEANNKLADDALQGINPEAPVPPQAISKDDSEGTIGKAKQVYEDALKALEDAKAQAATDGTQADENVYEAELKAVAEAADGIAKAIETVQAKADANNKALAEAIEKTYALPDNVKEDDGKIGETGTWTAAKEALLKAQADAAEEGTQAWDGVYDDAIQALKEAQETVIAEAEANNQLVTNAVLDVADYLAADPDGLLNQDEYKEIRANEDVVNAMTALEDAVKDALAAVADAEEAGTQAKDDIYKAELDAIAEAKQALIDEVEAKKIIAAANESEVNDALAETYDPGTRFDDIDETQEVVDAMVAWEEAKKALEDALQNSKDNGLLADDQYLDEDGETKLELDDLIQAVEDALDTLQDAIDAATAIADEIDGIIGDGMAEEEKELTEGEITKAKVANPEEVTQPEGKLPTTQAQYQELIEDLTDLIYGDGALQDQVEAKKADYLAGKISIDELRDYIDKTLPTAEEDVKKDAVERIVEYLMTVQRGDVGGDGRWTTNDYARLRKVILSEEYPTSPAINEKGELDVEKIEFDKSGNPDTEALYEFYRMDINQDGDINVGDAQAALNYTFYGSMLGPVAEARAEAGAEVMNATMNGNVIAVTLTNSRQYSALQMDVVLAEGMTVTAAKVAGRTADYSIATNELPNGATRILLTANEAGQAFEGNQGEVLFIEVAGMGQVDFQNIILADLNASTAKFNLNGVVGGATGIAGTAAANGDEQVFSLSGRVMNALKKGVNIIRRADGSTQKVIKK